MGSDIHGVIEVKGNGGWKIVDGIPEDRCYDLFGLLFGVRNYVRAEPIAPNRGIPTDYTAEEMRERLMGYGDAWNVFDIHDFDLHSHTYITRDDFAKWDMNKSSRYSRGSSYIGDSIWKSGGSLEGPIPPDTDQIRYRVTTAREIIAGTSWEKVINDMREKEWRAVVAFDN